MMERSNEEQQAWVGARAVLDAPSTPTMSRDMHTSGPSSGGPVAEGDDGFRGGGQEGLIWKGASWDACPFLCMCCAPVRRLIFCPAPNDVAAI